MALNSGTRFGPYEIVEKIGAGGMGEVYRAKDTALKRDVAVKVLPASFANDRDRLDRFQREAEVLASLNHSNIAQIYGLENADGQTVIVMELVDGPTLAERIAQGPLPPDEALAIARQVADALEAAHGRQVVHRDLKPANVKVKPDGTIKILDFGIAKTVEAQAISGGRSPAMATPAVTETGIILGTAAYMSPEQARGKPVDQRTDIWAFGCLLFEMLTGQPAFAGEDVMLTLARVLDRDTDMSSMPGTISPAVRHTIKLCLEKDPRKRIADIRDVRLALQGTFETALPRGAQAEEPASRRALPLAAAAAVAAALLVGVAVWLLKPTPPPEPKIVTRFDYELPEGVTLRNPVVSVLDIAPSGEFFAFQGSNGINVRAMGETEGRVIPGTEGAEIADVVISPDGREVAFFRAPPMAGLIKLSLDGGAPIVLVSPIENPYGLSWEPDGTIYYGQPDGIWRVAENGGTPERVIETQGSEQAYGPQLLPGGEWLLFTLARQVSANRWNEADIVIQSLSTGERRVLRSGGHDARYLPTGHVTYVFENVLFASAFDVETLTLGDERVSLIQGVQTALPVIGGSGFYALSTNGTLVFVPGTAGPVTRPQKGLVWVDREGNAEPLSVRPDDYNMVRISPDGTKIALVVGRTLPATDPPPDIYIFDLETENLTQLTFNPLGDDGPVWSRDGSRLFFRGYGEDGPASIFVIPADGGTPEFLASSGTGQNPLPWAMAPDDKTLVLVDAPSLQDVNLAQLDIGNAEQTVTLLDLVEQLSEPSLSPNGQWLLYYQFTTGNASDAEINIRPFPDVRQQRRPVALGIHPVFSSDGAEIFFFDGAGLSAASVQYTPFRVSAPQKLFRGQYWYGVATPQGALGRAWDVDPKNDRFLMITLPDTGDGETDAQAPVHISVVLNWFEELNQRVPKR
jgi:serine/threonine-protein kinase